MSRSLAAYDLVCLSHLRWDFVYQRPQHLLTRCAQTHRVFFVEEPILDGGPARLEVSPRQPNLWVAVPHLPAGLTAEDAACAQRELLDGLLAEQAIHDYVLWIYTPMALPGWRPSPAAGDGLRLHGRALAPSPAPVRRCRRSKPSFSRGPTSCLPAARACSRRSEASIPRSTLFPVRSIGRTSPRRAKVSADPADQASIPHPRLGFYGVIDERMDLDLLACLADAQPQWHLVLVGPVAKIDPAALPRRRQHPLSGR